MTERIGASRWLKPWARTFVLGLTLLVSVTYVVQQSPLLDFPLESRDEYRHFINYGGLNFLGVWHMWSEGTIDYERPIHTGLYYYTSLAVGAVLQTVMGDEIRTFAFAARLTALLMSLAVVWAMVLLLGRHTQWHPVLGILPLWFMVNPEWLVRATRVYADGTMLFFLVLTLWASARFLHQPGRRSYKHASILMTLAFAAKPAVLPFYLFFIGLNAYQVWRDKQPFWRELRWRSLKGLKYFVLTFLLASPFSATSFGLFLSSMRSEAAATATKFILRPWTDWLVLAADPRYLGLPLMLLIAVAGVGWGLWNLREWRRYQGMQRPQATLLERFISVSFLWGLAFTVFVLVMSHSFILRYLDPAAVPFIVAIFGVVAWLGQRAKVVSWGLALLVLAATAHSAWHGLPVQERYHRDLLSIDGDLAIWRGFNADLKALVAQDAHILYTPFLLVDRDIFSHTERFHRLRRYHFQRNRPEYLLVSTKRFDFYEDFLDYDHAYSRADAERMATATFWREVEETQINGALEVVKHWPGGAKATLYRFVEPVDDAFIARLFKQVYEAAGTTEPGRD